MKSLKILLLAVLIAATTCSCAFTQEQGSKWAYTQLLKYYNISSKQLAFVDSNKRESLFFWNEQTLFMRENQPISEEVFFSSHKAPAGYAFEFEYAQTSNKKTILRARIVETSE